MLDTLLTTENLFSQDKPEMSDCEESGSGDLLTVNQEAQYC